MFISYTSSPLESWVSNWYLKMNIYKPSDISIHKICKIHRIFYSEKPLPSYSKQNGNFKIISVDSRLSIEKQHEVAFHELCHILRHSGMQGMMPEAFRELQERDARHFTKYASIPHHMILDLDFDSPNVIEQMSSTFKVSQELCVERLLQIKKKTFHSRRGCHGYIS